MFDGANADTGIHISVVAAAYNEVDNLAQLIQEINAAIDTIGEGGEIIIANDGSTDGSADLLKTLMSQYPRLRVFTLVPNSGQTAAWDAGLRQARGRYIATLDADLQNDPADIPRMLELIEKGETDLVNGWRANRNDPWIRLVSTKIANAIRNRLTHENIHDSACGLKVFKRECLANVKLFTGLHRFIPTLARMEGYRVKEIVVNHRPRTAGVAKYGVGNRIFKALRDTFAIRWMQSRIFHYQLEEMRPDDQNRYQRIVSDGREFRGEGNSLDDNPQFKGIGDDDVLRPEYRKKD